MAKNFVQAGEAITCVAPAGGVVAGTVYLLGGLIVVAATSAAVGESFEGHTGGVWDFTNKTLANTPAFGARAYLTAAGTEITTTLAGNTLIGVFLSSGGGASGLCRVRLNGTAPA
jgi:predicted RecA/RadA family phage recombinase